MSEWILAPAKPTPEMKKAANKAVCINTPDGTWALGLDEASRAYKAMLDAAPAHRSPDTAGCYANLSRMIAARLLGVKPDEQDIELDDNDWRLVIDALLHKASAIAKMHGDETTAGTDIAAVLKLSHQHILGSDPEVTSGGIKNADLREIIETSIAKLEAAA